MSYPTPLVVGPDESGNVEFGVVLRRLRESAVLSRAEAARKIGFTSEYLRLIEKGKRTPALGHMRRILETYEVDFQIDLNVVTFENYYVSFTSRIQEKRGKTPDPHYVGNRDETVGKIVRLLTLVDDGTLLDIHRLLRRRASRV